MEKVPFLRKLSAGIILALAALGLSCSGASKVPVGGFETPEGAGYVFFGDAPPTGTSILRFEITLASATLCPTVSGTGECTGNPQVDMLAAPVRLDLTQLQMRSAFLGFRDPVAAGSYAGVRLTFSNPKLLLLEPDGTYTELIGVTLPLNPASVTPTFASPLTVSDKTNFGFQIDFDVQESIQSAAGVVTGVAPVVSLIPQTFATGQPVVELEETTGRVSSLTKSCATPSGTFNLLDALTGLTIASVEFDSSTDFGDGITCDLLSVDQIVEADIELVPEDASTATFLARKIDLVTDVNETGLEGTILQVNTTSEFVLFVQHSAGGTGLSEGAVVTVSFDPQDVVFIVASDGLPADPALFASGAHLLAGQTVELDVVGVTLGTHSCAEITDNCLATVEEVKLKTSTFTGTVGQEIVQPNFALTTLPSIFGSGFPVLFRPLSADCQSCVIDAITVVTSTGTEYEGLPGGFSSLLTGANVTVRGLLLKNGFQGPGPPGTGLPQLVVQKVRLVTAAP